MAKAYHHSIANVASLCVHHAFLCALCVKAFALTVALALTTAVAVALALAVAVAVLVVIP